MRDARGKPGEREVAGVDWIFNAWGGKLGGLYDPWCAAVTKFRRARKKW